MAKKTKVCPELQDHEHYKTLEKKLAAMRSGYRVADNFEILMEIAAISLSNLVRTDKFDEREKRYYKLIEAVDYEAATAAFGEIIMWFHEQAEPRDLLGPLHSYLGLDNSGSGQFFTPRHICDFMNQCLMPSKENVEATIADKGYISIQDPTVGAGGMLVAAAKVLNSYEIDYTRNALFCGTELMQTTAHTCFVQCALYNMPAVITHGDSLKMQDYDQFITAQGWALMNRIQQTENKAV